MIKEPRYIDISNIPVLIELAEEAHRTRKPIVLQRNGENVLVLLPLRPKPEYDWFRQTATDWDQLVDPEALELAKPYL